MAKFTRDKSFDGKAASKEGGMKGKGTGPKKGGKATKGGGSKTGGKNAATFPKHGCKGAGK